LYTAILRLEARHYAIGILKSSHMITIFSVGVTLLIKPIMFVKKTGVKAI